MQKNNKKAKKIAISILCITFLIQQTMIIPAIASTISGIDGTEITPGGNQQFDINAQFQNGNIGFRHYDKFDLTQGDIANLIYNTGMKGFINLVNSQIKINGILNTINSTGNFANGNAIFVSPMGMVVGASGVLNVGSLTAIAPNPTDFYKYTAFNVDKAIDNNPILGIKLNNIKNSIVSAYGLDLSQITIPIEGLTLENLKTAPQNADIKIDGKVISRKDIELYGTNISIDKNAQLFASIGNNLETTTHDKFDTKIETLEQTNKLFTALVDNKVTNGVGFAKENGKVVIKAMKNSDINGGVFIEGKIDNHNGDINIEADGTSGIKSTDTSSITNNNGDTNLTNNGNGILEFLGSIFNKKGNINVVNASTSTSMKIKQIEASNGDVTITNNGNDSTTIENVKAKNNISITNSNNCLGIKGTIENELGNIVLTNSGSDKILIDNNGKIQALKGDINITNNGANGLNIMSSGEIVNKNGNTLITNNKGNMEIIGSIMNNNGNLIINNTDGKLNITQDKGNKISNINNTNQEFKTEIKNSGANGMTIAKNSKIENSGNSTIEIINTNGMLTIGNYGKIYNNSTVKTKENLVIENSGHQGASGMMFNGRTNILNESGSARITNNSGTLMTTADTIIKNNISGGAQTDSLTIQNQANNSSSLNGTIENNIGDLIISNGNISNGITNSTLTLNGNITNLNGNTNIDNVGNKGLFIGTLGIINNNNGNLNVNNTGTNGTTVAGMLKNKDGDLVLNNTAGGVRIKQVNRHHTIENLTTNKGLKTEINNTGDKGILVQGSIFNKGKSIFKIYNKNDKIVTELNGAIESDSSGKDANENNLIILNDGENGIKFESNVKNWNGNTQVINNGAGKLQFYRKFITYNGNTDIDNTNANSGIEVGGMGNIYTYNHGNMDILNEGAQGILIRQNGLIHGAKGDVNITNNQGGITVKGEIVNSSNKNETKTTNITNNGLDGITVDTTGKISSTENTKLKITNNSGDITVKENGLIYTKANSKNKNIENLTIENNSDGVIRIQGNIENNLGNTLIANKKDATTSAIILETTGNITNSNGNIQILNQGKSDIGIDIDGHITAINNEININNQNSKLVIGEYNSANDNYITGKTVVINQKNGDILNGIVDANAGNNQNHDLGNKDKAYKTLIKTKDKLTFNIDNGNIGKNDKAIAGKEPGFGINASTRDYTESINIKAGNLKVSETNDNVDSITNIRAKDSDLKIDDINRKGNIILTAADWKQADSMSKPQPNSYYEGYSIIDNSSKSQITGKNISLISSNNIGTSENPIKYNQAENGSFSAEAENNLYLKGLGKKDNIWQLISKRGDMELDFSGDTVIREITSGKNLNILNRGKNLTIYDLGKTTNLPKEDDILYPHDQIDMANVSPEKINISVLDVAIERPQNQKANSILNIFNAYVKGKNDGKADVTLKADTIIAHAYDAKDSKVSTQKRPNGFNAKENRTYANDINDVTATKDLQAKGFNTVGEGSALVFDIQGVSPNSVTEAGEAENSRTYDAQEANRTLEIFQNPAAFTETVYKNDDVTLSLNSANDSPETNRGMLIDKLYTNNAYIDTKDLNLKINDGFVTNYGEFKNGNLGGSGGANSLDSEYRWVSIVDNDYNRNIANVFNTKVTSQLYTKLTGSFGLELGDLIALQTKAPVVAYDPHEVIIQSHTENSFYRLTYKDDKIQKNTTTPEFQDIDKATYKPTKREFIRFNVVKDDGFVNVASIKEQKKARIISILDISRGGLKVVHDGTLKKGEKLIINLSYQDINVSPEVEVMRVSNDLAGLKFINLDSAVANKILYMNMMITKADKQHISKL